MALGKKSNLSFKTHALPSGIQDSGVLVSQRLLEQGAVTGPALAALQQQHSGQLLQMRLDPAARCGPPVVRL